MLLSGIGAHSQNNTYVYRWHTIEFFADATLESVLTANRPFYASTTASVATDSLIPLMLTLLIMRLVQVHVPAIGATTSI